MKILAAPMLWRAASSVIGPGAVRAARGKGTYRGRPVHRPAEEVVGGGGPAGEPAKRPRLQKCPCKAWKVADLAYQGFSPETKREIRRRVVYRRMSAYDHWMKWAVRRLTRNLRAPPWPPAGYSWTDVSPIPDEVLQAEGYPADSIVYPPPECRSFGLLLLYWRRWWYQDQWTGEKRTVLVAYHYAEVDGAALDWPGPYWRQYGWMDEDGVIRDISPIEKIHGAALEDYVAIPDADYPAYMLFRWWQSTPRGEPPERRARDEKSRIDWTLSTGPGMIWQRSRVDPSVSGSEILVPEVVDDPAYLTGEPGPFTDY